MSGPTLVRDVMRPAVVASERMWFRELVRLLHERDVEFVTIIDPDGRAVGAVTEGDLLLKLAGRRVEGHQDERDKAGATTARGLMSEPLVSVRETDSAAEAVRLLRWRRLHHLAVLDRAGRPVGAVEQGDLLALLLRPDREIKEDVEDLLAWELRGAADSVGVEVCDGVVLLRRLRDVDLALEDVLPDVLEVEGVLAARLEDPSAAERWRCPS